MVRTVELPPIVRVLIIGASLVIIIAGLKAGASILAPTLFALLLTVAVVPIIQWLDRKGLPTWAAVTLVILSVAIIGVGLVSFISVSLATLADNLPAYQASLISHANEITAWAAGVGITLPHTLPRDLVNASRVLSILGAFLGTLGSGLGSMFLILLLFTVFSIQAPQASSRVRDHLGDESPAISRFITLGGAISSYFRVRAINNLFVSITLTILLWVLGVDLAGLWGVLAFFLGFIPNIGLPLAVIPAVLLGWLEQGWITALIVIGGTIVINFLGDNVLTPRLAGKALNMSTAIVFLSFIFWAWVFGALGALISIPLTAIVMAALDSSGETRWLTALMSADSVPSKTGGEAPVEEQP